MEDVDQTGSETVYDYTSFDTVQSRRQWCIGIMLEAVADKVFKIACVDDIIVEAHKISQFVEYGEVTVVKDRPKFGIV